MLLYVENSVKVGGFFRKRAADMTPKNPFSEGKRGIFSRIRAQKKALFAKKKALFAFANICLLVF